MFFDRQRKSLGWKRNAKEQKEESRHERGMTIPEEDITVITPNACMCTCHNICYYMQVVEDRVWHIKSQSSTTTKGYSVVMREEGCTLPGCSIKCTKPECNNLCRHLYTCECYDYANGHICKHIHAIAMKKTEREEVPAEDTSSDAPCVLTNPDPVLKENVPAGTFTYKHNNRTCSYFTYCFHQIHVHN